MERRLTDEDIDELVSFYAGRPVGREDLEALVLASAQTQARKLVEWLYEHRVGPLEAGPEAPMTFELTWVEWQQLRREVF